MADSAISELMQAPSARPLLPLPHMCKETSGPDIGFEFVDDRVIKHEMGSYLMRVMNGIIPMPTPIEIRLA